MWGDCQGWPQLDPAIHLMKEEEHHVAADTVVQHT